MPRAICHLSLFFKLQDQLQVERPAIAALIDQHLAATLAGLVAPDALRIFGRLDKFATHFYLDRDPVTWGRSVEMMCRTRPEISDPQTLSPPEQAFVLGYISHLTVDEAFRETVTVQLSGNPRWREIVAGLWSLADELPVDRPGLVETLQHISQPDIPKLTDPVPVQRLLAITAAVVACPSTWERELLQRRHFGNRFGLKDGQANWEQLKQMSLGFFAGDRRQTFVETALRLGLQEVDNYWNSHYANSARE
jgi:hypothetical protein